MRTKGSLYTAISNKIATVEFGHPASNSFTADMLERLTNTLNDLSTKEEVSVIVLKSEGKKAFCAGASFNELTAVSNLSEGTQFFSGFANVINAMRNCSKIIVGRIQGKTVGGGVGIAAACDYVFACEGASVKLSELSIGIAPLVIAPVVAHRIGKAALGELSLAPTEWKNAYWAKEKGLFAKVFENTNDLDKELDFYTNQLSEYNPEALKAWKKVLWEGTEHWSKLLVDRAAITGELVLSKATKQALSKFKK